MKKTITIEIEVHTDPLPPEMVGINPYRIDNKSAADFVSKFPFASVFPDDISEHGNLDAPEYIPAGYCYKTDHGKYVYDGRVKRGY